jgi:uncharacterized membrane protein
MTKHRLEMFSDGVFAIVITILILNIHLPDETSTKHLGQALEDLAPNILAYVISFILIGLYWIAHHTSFHHIHKVNGVFLWLNMLLLLLVSFMPFPASLLGKYPLEPVSLMIYGINLIAANSVGFTMTWYTCYHPELLTEPFSIKDFRKQFPLYFIVNGLYLAAILLAPAIPVVSYVIYIAMALLLVFYYARIGTK